MLNDAERWGMIDRNPILAIRKFRSPEMDFHFWNVSEVRQILRILESKSLTHQESILWWVNFF